MKRQDVAVATSMRIVADRTIPFVTEAFSALGEVKTLPTSAITNSAVREADILVIRNETTVDENLLAGSRVQFVASATAGSDHFDAEYLRASGIGWANAAGCNAESVKEYVVAALLAFAVDQDILLRGKTLGVIGVGHIGGRVVEAALALDMTVLQNDPPLARTTGDPKYLPLEQVLAADFITLHTPLTRTGPDATYHLFDEACFKGVKPGAVLINASRGAVVETSALKHALRHGPLSAALIDVWENEPEIDPELLSHVALGTAHVAGYSMEGKLRAVQLARQAVCRHLGIADDWNARKLLDAPDEPEIRVEAQGLEEHLLHACVRQAYDIQLDVRLLQEILSLPPGERAAHYTSLRTGYRWRHEFSAYRVRLRGDQERLRPTLAALGFSCSAAAHESVSA